jgi:hypothetical protein
MENPIQASVTAIPLTTTMTDIANVTADVAGVADVAAQAAATLSQTNVFLNNPEALIAEFLLLKARFEKLEADTGPAVEAVKRHFPNL